MARLALGFVASVLIARALGPADFGTFAVLAAVANVVGALADLGLTDAAVKRIASAWAGERARAIDRGRAFFWLRAGSAALVVVAGHLVVSALPTVAVGSSTMRSLLVLALLGVFATALSGAVSALLQATQRFGRLSLVGLANAGLTALLAIALDLTGQLTLISALVVLGIGTSLVSFAVGVRLLPDGWRLAFPPRATLWAEGRPMLDFGRWLWVANVCAMLAAQLDVLLVDRWTDAAIVGAYALALNLAMKVDVVNSSLYTVLLPAVSSLDGEHAIRRYVRQALLRSALIALALLPLLLLIGPFITFFYGRSYAPAIGIFRLLLAVVVFDVFATPLLLLIYHYDRPRLLAASDALRAGTLGVAGVALVPSFGTSGAVVAKLVAKAVGAALTLWSLRRSSAAPARKISPS